MIFTLSLLKLREVFLCSNIQNLSSLKKKKKKFGHIRAFYQRQLNRMRNSTETILEEQKSASTDEPINQSLTQRQFFLFFVISPFLASNFGFGKRTARNEILFCFFKRHLLWLFLQNLSLIGLRWDQLCEQ